MNLVTHLRFGIGRLLLLWLSALATGCGPTTGGTGTGDSIVTLADFGARAASTCSAVFATALDCDVVSTASVDAAALQGTDPVYFVGTAASGPYTLTLQNNRAVLQSRCHATRFEGDWGVLPSGEARFFGTWVGDDQAAPQRALLWVQTVPGKTGALQALVQQPEGQALFGPLPLERVMALPTAVAPCQP